jgi:hypothetical protein
VENPEEQFGPYQMTATIIGFVLIVLGLVMCACKGECSCAAPPAEEPAAEEPAAEEPEAPAPEASEDEAPADDAPPEQPAE